MNWDVFLSSAALPVAITCVMNFVFEKFRNDREIASKKKLQGFQDKLAIYRLVTDMFADFLAEYGHAQATNTPLTAEQHKNFDMMRMRTFGYLCTYADQECIDAHEHLVEYIFEAIEGKNDGGWAEVQTRAVRLLNSFRKDYDPALPLAAYNGKR